MFVVIKKRVLIIGILLLILLVFTCVLCKKNYIQTTKLSNNIVVIDPGHGGMDSGCVGKGGVLEKNINLEISKKLSNIFVKNGYNVVMTRTTDVILGNPPNMSVRSQKTADLKKRYEIANSSNCGIFISIHTNKYESEKIFGSQVFYQKGDIVGEEYAREITGKLKSVDPLNKRVAKILPNKNLVFSHLKVPGVLVECGFISNLEEMKKLQDGAYQNKIANAIYEAVAEKQR